MPEGERHEDPKLQAEAARKAFEQEFERFARFQPGSDASALFFPVCRERTSFRSRKAASASRNLVSAETSATTPAPTPSRTLASGPG